MTKHGRSFEVEQRVKRWAAVGLSKAAIAKRLGIPVKELEKTYRDTMRRAGPEMRAMVGARLFEAAKKGDIAAIIFWLKTRAGWSETITREVVAVEQPPPEKKPYWVILPCNLHCMHAQIIDRDERRQAYEKALGYKLPLPDAPTFPEFPTRKEHDEIYQLLFAHCMHVTQQLNEIGVCFHRGD